MLNSADSSTITFLGALTLWSVETAVGGCPSLYRLPPSIASTFQASLARSAWKMDADWESMAPEAERIAAFVRSRGWQPSLSAADVHELVLHCRYQKSFRASLSASQLGQARKAWAHLKECAVAQQAIVQLQPANAAHHWRLSITLLNLDRYGESVEATRAALELAGRNKGVLQESS